MDNYYYNPFETQNPNQPPVNQPVQPPVYNQPQVPPQVIIQQPYYIQEPFEIFERKKRIYEEKKEIRQFSLGLGLAIIAYLVIQTVSTLVLSAFGYSDVITNGENLVFTYGFTMLAVSFLSVAVPFGVVGFIFKSMGRYKYPIVPNKKIPFSRILAWVLFGMMCCIAAQVVVSFAVNFIESIFGVTLNQPEYGDADSVFTLIVEIIATAFVPAICEEFAMRCCSLQLLRKYGTGFAVFSVSIVFGLLHGNVIQFIFAFCIGLILGYVTVKTESIIPAVLIHGLNNGMSCVNSIFKYFINEEAGNIATVFMYIGFVILGIVALIFLFKWKEFSMNKIKADTVLTEGQKMSAFLFPWMIVPFIILILLTLSTISF